MDCPECNGIVSEDQTHCKCGAQLWSNKTLKSWNKLEVIRIVND